MKGKSDKKNKDKFSALLGQVTPAKQAGVAFSVSPFLSMALAFLFLALISAFGLAKEGYETQDWYLYANFLLPQISIALIAVFLLWWSKKPIKEIVKKQKCEWKYIFLALVLQIGLMSLSQLNNLFLELLKKFGYQSPNIQLPNLNGFGFIGVLFVVAVLPAILEETLFRGILFNGLQAFGKAGSVLLCGALFSLFHQNPAQTPYQFCCGVAYALLALRARSVLPTVIAHFFNNALIVVLTKYFGATFALPTGAQITVLIVSSVCLLFSLTYLIFFDKNKKTIKKDKQEQKTFFLYAAVGIFACALTWVVTLVMGIKGVL